MKLGVKFYRDVSKHDNAGIPDHWPAECVELQDDEAVPAGYTEMSCEQYLDYRQKHMSEYEAWEVPFYESIGMEPLSKLKIAAAGAAGAGLLGAAAWLAEKLL